MIRGPIDYVPSINVEIVAKRKAIPLNKDEGIYVRNTKTGHIKTVIGDTYMLNEEEDLWEKDLPPKIESLVYNKNEGHKNRNKTKVVKYHLPNNHIIKVYNFKNKNAR